MGQMAGRSAAKRRAISSGINLGRRTREYRVGQRSADGKFGNSLCRETAALRPHTWTREFLDKVPEGLFYLLEIIVEALAIVILIPAVPPDCGAVAQPCGKNTKKIPALHF